MNLRTICNELKSILQKHELEIGCPAKSIDFGKMEMPAEAPFIWIYPQPKDVPMPADDINKAEIMIYCGVASTDLTEGMFASLEMAEQCMLAIAYEFPPIFKYYYAYDTNYGNYSAALLSVECDYEVLGI